LWREPLRLDNRKLVSLIGPEPHTPVDEALRQTLSGLGCLPDANRDDRRSWRIRGADERAGPSAGIARLHAPCLGSAGRRI
jgi:hypothetical protein